MKTFGFLSLFVALTFVQVGCGEPAAPPATDSGAAVAPLEHAVPGAHSAPAADAPATDAPAANDAPPADDSSSEAPAP